MLALFLTFLAQLTERISSHYHQRADGNDAQLLALHKAYISLHRIYDHATAHPTCLIAWQQGSYHGSYWAGCQQHARLIYHAVMLLEADIDTLLGFEAHDRQWEFRSNWRGALQSKSDVFAIWTRIMRQNAEKNFCGWQTLARGERWQKRILIPDYSILLPTIATAQLDDPSNSYWRDHQWDRFDSAGDINWAALAYLPEIPSSTKVNDTTLLIPNYAATLLVPQEDERLNEIINHIRESIQAFQVVLTPLHALIVKCAQNDPAKLVAPITAV
jgi:hypothetical protein